MSSLLKIRITCEYLINARVTGYVCSWKVSNRNGFGMTYIYLNRGLTRNYLRKEENKYIMFFNVLLTPAFYCLKFSR